MKYLFSILILLLLAYALYHTFRMRHLIRLGEKVADTAVPFTQSVDTPTMKILFVGDSTAVGTGASSPSTSLAGLAAERYPNAQIDNLGANGAKLADAIEQLQSVTTSYDLLFLHVGGNDIVRLTPLDQVRREYQQVLALATSKAAKVLHTSTGNVGAAPFFPTPAGWYYSYRTRQVIDIIQEEIATYDQQHVRYTYLYTSRKDDPFMQDVDKYYLSDYFHPSDAGYALWWESMQPELDAMNI